MSRTSKRSTTYQKHQGQIQEIPTGISDRDTIDVLRHVQDKQPTTWPNLDNNCWQRCRYRILSPSTSESRSHSIRPADRAMDRAGSGSWRSLSSRASGWRQCCRSVQIAAEMYADQERTGAGALAATQKGTDLLRSRNACDQGVNNFVLTRSQTRRFRLGSVRRQIMQQDGTGHSETSNATESRGKEALFRTEPTTMMQSQVFDLNRRAITKPSDDAKQKTDHPRPVTSSMLDEIRISKENRTGNMKRTDVVCCSPRSSTWLDPKRIPV